MGGIVSPRDSPQACFYTISTVLQTGARKTSKTCVYSLQDSDTHYCISVHEDCSIAFSKLQPSLLIDWFVGDWWAWVIEEKPCSSTEGDSLTNGGGAGLGTFDVEPIEDNFLSF
jgi:hypothetical protein